MWSVPTILSIVLIRTLCSCAWQCLGSIGSGDSVSNQHNEVVATHKCIQVNTLHMLVEIWCRPNFYKLTGAVTISCHEYPPFLPPTLMRQDMMDQGADRAAKERARATARTLVEEAWQAAAAGAAREHALRRLIICRQLQDMADELEVGGVLRSKGAVGVLKT